MWFVYLLIWLTVAVGFQALAQVLVLAACREELQEEAGKEQQAEEKYVCTETWDGYRGCFCLCDFFFSFKKHPILNKNCRVRLQLEKSAKQKALRSRELELATPRHLCTSLWETGNAQLGTELCLDLQPFGKVRKWRSGRAGKHHALQLHSKPFLFASQW